MIPAEPDNTPSRSIPTNSTNHSSSSTTTTTTTRERPIAAIPMPQQQQPTLQLQRKLIPVDPTWEDKVVYVMAQYYQEDRRYLVGHLRKVWSVEGFPITPHETFL